MKFVSRTPQEGINVSDVHPVTEATTLIVGLTAIVGVIAIVLFFFVDAALLYVSPTKEAAIFSDWTPDDLRPVTADDSRHAATQALLEQLTKHWPDSPYSIRLQINESETINAMASPGGLIIVTTGLLDQVESENELTFVLGHELGHFRNRDHIRGLGRALVLTILMQALGIGDDASTLGIGLADIAARSFSRSQETEADYFGLFIVHAEYGHIGESWRFFERLKNARDIENGLLAYYSTHPSPDDRAQNLKAYAHEQGWPLAGTKTSLKW